jgi:hypothetical protein
MQWHPLFAHLLRPLLQEHYHIQTDVPVGDLPREADIVLVRRVSARPPSFHGIWRHLRRWNVLEFKGPTDSPALRDLDLLLEVGLGIERRLNEERARQGDRPLDRAEVSYWYLANHVGQRFCGEVERLLGQALEGVGEGLWRCRAFERVLLVVSRDLLPVDGESVPLHLVTRESAQRSRQLAVTVLKQPRLVQDYGSFLAQLHPEALEEVLRMNPLLEKEPTFDLQPLIKLMGLKRVIDQIGLKQVIDQVGLKQVIDQVGLKQVIDEVGLDGLLAELSPEQIAELQRRLPSEAPPRPAKRRRRKR